MLTLLAATIAYFIPWMVAAIRGHNSSPAILVTNLLLGWTGLGWVIALIWAFTSNVKQRVVKA